jgi:hypothetical protein
MVDGKFYIFKAFFATICTNCLLPDVRTAKLVFHSESLWPKVVRERIQATYTYFAGSLMVTAASAYGIARSRFIHRWMAASPWLVKSTA